MLFVPLALIIGAFSSCASASVTLNVTSAFNVTAVIGGRASCGVPIPAKYLPAGSTFGAQFRATDTYDNVYLLSLVSHPDGDGKFVETGLLLANATEEPGHYRAVTFEDGGSNSEGLTVAGSYNGHFLTIVDNAFGDKPTFNFWEYKTGSHYNPSAAKSIVIGANYDKEIVYTVTDDAVVTAISLAGGNPVVKGSVSLGTWKGTDEKHCAGSVSQSADTALVYCSSGIFGRPAFMFKVSLVDMTVSQTVPADDAASMWLARANPTLTWDEKSGTALVTMLASPGPPPAQNHTLFFFDDSTLEVVGSQALPGVDLAMIENSVFDRSHSMAHLLANNGAQVFSVGLAKRALAGETVLPNPSANPINQQFVNSLVLGKDGLSGIAIEVGPSYQLFAFTVTVDGL